MVSISLEELHLYHKIDREIFSRLVIHFMRDPAESLLVMALWLWLEEKGYPNIIMRMIGLPDPIVNALADEAVRCLKCLESTNFRILQNGGGLPLTARILQTQISLHIFNQHRFTAISGIKIFLNNVCARVFADILEAVLAGSSSQTGTNQPIVVPGFPHPMFGAVNVMTQPMDYDFPTEELWGWRAIGEVSEDDRTMFLTFSRGFPVSEAEVRELFTGMFGNCVESVYMGNGTSNNDQPLYARMVLNSVVTVDRILDGMHISKFRINGKHIWARKYERRE
ncbi:uncharacterized protein LOC107421197 [Ziziphus jujuba]|uniref:Uncharacterized protein LOC107421197 n=2 Tax=Ziziphus jujuba TaxID=326968 RepID=A0A6P3ZYW3_ZIZJJ|nr:uncharacterized protein LOC107421197 [Ziziphus jujuba]KAH7524663.1 hypothetical protein FEM48_Zijuj06G0143500 [Ziziphus jujuba var. spinosa]